MGNPIRQQSGKWIDDETLEDLGTDDDFAPDGSPIPIIDDAKAMAAPAVLAASQRPGKPPVPEMMPVFGAGVDLPNRPAPAARPDRDGQMRDDVSKNLAALGFLEAGSQGVGNIANLFQRGASDAGATSRMFEGFRDQVRQPLADAAQKRAGELAAAKEGRERQKFETDQAGATMKLEQDRAKIDPGSEFSKGMRESAVAELRASAQARKNSPGAAVMLDMANKIEANPGISGQTVLEMVKRLGPAAKEVNDVMHQRAMEGIAYAGQTETKRMHNAQIANMEADNARAAEARTDITIRKPQEKLNQDMSKMRVALGAMHELKALKSGLDASGSPILGADGKAKGKLNTGFLANFLSGVGEKFDATSTDRQQLNALVARIFNKETKELAGAAVSAAEWARIAPQIPQAGDDDGVFMAKLEMAIQETERLLEARKQEYQTVGGKPIDSSNVARSSARPDNAALPNAAPKAVDPKAEAAKRIIDDPSAPAAKKAKAQEYLSGAGQR